MGIEGDRLANHKRVGNTILQRPSLGIEESWKIAEEDYDHRDKSDQKPNQHCARFELSAVRRYYADMSRPRTQSLPIQACAHEHKVSNDQDKIDDIDYRTHLKAHSYECRVS